MSTFPGYFRHLPGVACDRFNGDNLNADQFFLSHCHSDHMVGIERLVEFLVRRNQVKVNHRIYCSKISKAFLLNKHKRLQERFIGELQPDVQQKVSIFNKSTESMYNLLVKAIPANHCPGSVMFLFETEAVPEGLDHHRILYTGDFRFENIPLTSLHSLHHPNLEPIRVDEMYLDTTFCTPNYPTFPKRDEATQAIWNIVSSWIRKNGMYRKHRAKHVVLFHLPAQYGSEVILRNIYERSNSKWKIHVPSKRFDDYLCLEDLGDCTDEDPKRAQWIHACSWKDPSYSRNGELHSPRSIPCQNEPYEVCIIRPSALYFNEACLKATEPEGVKRNGSNHYRICYSCHSSRDELREFVKHFKPKKIIPSVMPKGISLEEIMSQFENVVEPSSLEISPEPHVFQSLGSPPPQASTLGSPNTHSIDLGLAGWKSPDKTTRKRRQSGNNPSGVPIQVESPAGSPIPRKTLAIRALDQGDQDSSDDGGPEPPGQRVRARSKRKLFHRSRSSKSNYSMPVASSGNFIEVPSQQNRRASLPHNLKIPAITITPSSPSPDPNHPDYPEFFEDKLYLDTKLSMSTSSESGEYQGLGDKVSSSRQSASVESMETALSRDKSELDISDLNLRLSPEMTEALKTPPDNASSSLEVCFEQINSAEVIHLADDDDLNKNTGEDSEEMEQSTPDLEEIISNATNEMEREHCRRFGRSHVGKKCLNLQPL